MIGIRREDKNVWERRAPLTPDHVAELCETHRVRIGVQRSERRAFSERDYLRGGASLVDDLDGCSVVLGVKEMPAELFRPGRAYLFFSHVTKGQAHNMPMLRRLVEQRATLLDYELVVDERGRRLIVFGKHAGYAGMIDALWALGKRLAAEGLLTPFDDVRLAHEYSGLDEAAHHLTRIGERLRHTGLPPTLRPIAFGFTGSGNVSEGAQEIFDRLPTQTVHPFELENLDADPDRPTNVVYKAVIPRELRVVRRDGGPFGPDEFAERPELYRNGIDRWLPHLTGFVHGSFWNPDQPRLVSREDLRRLWTSERPRLRIIADIACDIGGGIEATLHATTPGNPVFVYDPATGEATDGVRGDGPVVLAVDNLPCQLPVDASQHFGDGLARFVPALARCDWSVPLEQLALPRSLRDAIIVHRGELTARFRHLEALIAP